MVVHVCSIQEGRFKIKSVLSLRAFVVVLDLCNLLNCCDLRKSLRFVGGPSNSIFSVTIPNQSKQTVFFFISSLYQFLVFCSAIFGFSLGIVDIGTRQKNASFS